MAHQPYHNWLIAEVADLIPADRAALDDHLARCADCQTLRDGLAQLDRLFQNPAVVPAPTGFALRFQSRLAARESRPRWFLGGAALGLGALGVLVALGLALAPLAIGAVRVAALPDVLAGILGGAVSIARIAAATLEALFTGLRVLLVYLTGQPLLATYAVTGLGVVVVWVEMLRKLAPQEVHSR